MAGQRFSPGPGRFSIDFHPACLLLAHGSSQLLMLIPFIGKTAPRLVEDILDYDPSKRSKNGRNLVADSAPQYRPDTLFPPRKGLTDCRHSLMRKNNGEESLADSPQSNDERPTTKSRYNVESYCSKCRYHFQIKISFESELDDPVICHLSDADNPMHHLRLTKSMKGQEWKDLVGLESFKYDPLLESHQFVCTAPRCPALTEVRISPPRLSPKLLAPVLNPAKLYQRGQAQIRDEPARYAGQSPLSVFAALGFFRTYLVNAKSESESGVEIRRIAKRNKKYMLAFANECDALFEYVGFETVEGEVDPEVCSLISDY
jgi:ubiquitin carboxyl-terminal hydrolase 25/28